MAFLEANRYLYLTTPLGDDKLLLHSFEGEEASAAYSASNWSCWPRTPPPSTSTS